MHLLRARVFVFLLNIVVRMVAGAGLPG